MNWLKNIFKCKPVVVTKTVQVPLPSNEKWTPHDQKATQFFFRSEQGVKFINACRQKLFADHLNACAEPNLGEYHNAKMRGANDLIFFMLTLANEDSISSNDSLANESTSDQDQSNLESATRS